MKKCTHCEHDNPTTSNFCNNCGANLNPSDPGAKAAPLSNIKKPKRRAERRQLTILFCDLVGSTPLSEQLDPEEFRQVILDYHQIAETVIARHGGHVGNYLGDGLLVYFGYPEGLEDAPKAGVQAGLEIIEAVAEANREWVAAGRIPIKIRIGIHTGLVVVDDHLALGETVNTAARLEGLAPHNGLVVSPKTMNLIQGWFEVKSTGIHNLKGISEPMEVFQIMKESGAKTRLDIAKGRGLSPLVGREHELRHLTEHWAQAKNGKGSLLLLGGEAGIGKSRLVDSIEKQIDQESGNLLLAARCSAYQRNSAFYPIIELLEKGVFQFDSSDGPQEKLIKIERFLLHSGLDFKMAMPLFTEFLSIPSKQFPPLIMSPVAKRQKTMEGLTKVLLHLATDKPLLFVIEDLHWADASTLEWLKLFLEEFPKRAIFMLCTTRPSFRPDWTERPDVTQLTLQRLTSEEMANICHHQTKGKALPKEVLEQITNKTEGVPLFVEELTKMVLESNLLVEKQNDFELAGPLSSLSIPSTLQDSLLARLDRLSNVKEIVQMGSVLGREFSFEILNAVLPQMEEENSLAKSLSQLLEAEIFYLKGKGQQSVYQFKHALIQDAAYESLLKSRRQQLHRQVANVLEHQFAGTVQTQPELLAHHFTEAGQPLQAIPNWLKAGQMASQKNATSEAIAHLEKGIDLLPNVREETARNNLELDFRLTLGGTFVVSHGFPHPKVKETFNRARDIAQTIEISPKLALVLLNLLSYYMNTEDYKAHDELSTYMGKLAKDPAHGYWFELFNDQLGGDVGIIQGKFKQANQSYQRVLEIFDPTLPFPWELSPSGHLEVGTKAWQMVCLQILGHIDQAKSLSDNHLSFAKEHKDSMTLYHIYTFPALLNLVAREWKSAEKDLEIYLPIVREFGDPVFMLTADVYYNIAKGFQGDIKAFETAVGLVNVCFDIGFKAFAVSMSSYIAEQYFCIGEHKSALSWIKKIMDHVNKTGSHIHTAELFRVKGLALQALGEPDTVVENNFKEALELSIKQAAKTYELRAACDLARLWQKQRKTNEAKDLLKGTYDWFTEGFDSVDLQEAKALLSELSTNDLVKG